MCCEYWLTILSLETSGTMGRKHLRKKGNNLDKEISKEIIASSSEWDFSITINFLKLKLSIWLIWVYIKLILKLITFLCIKNKSQANEIASYVKTDAVPVSNDLLVSLLKIMLSFFNSSESILFDFMNPSDVSLVDELCSLCRQEVFFLVLLYNVALALAKIFAKFDKETTSEHNMEAGRVIPVDIDKANNNTKKETKDVKLTDNLKSSKLKQQIIEKRGRIKTEEILR